MQLDELISLNELPVMIYALNESEEIIYANKLFLKETGFEKPEILNKSVNTLLTERTKELIKNVYRPELKRTGRLDSFPLEMIVKDGKNIQLLGSSYFVEDDGIIILIGTARNVSTLLTRFDDKKFIREWIARPSELNAKLLKLRQKVNNTQEQMAETLKISTRTYQRLEHGAEKLTLSQVITLAEEFSISPNYFFTNFSFT